MTVQCKIGQIKDEERKMSEKANTGKGTILGIMEWIAVFAVIHYCFFRFFEATTFYFDFTDTYRTITFALIVGIGLLRLISGLWMDFRDAETGEERRKVILKGTLALLAAIPCVLIANRYGYTFFAYLPFTAYCLYGIDAEKVLKAFTLSIGIILLCTIVCSLTGAIQNYLYLSEKGKLRGSYGIAFPTDFASYLVFQFLFFWSFQKKQAWWHTTLFVFLGLVMCWICRTYPHSDTSTILSLVCVFMVLYDALDHAALSRHKGACWLSKLGEGAVTWAFPILGIVFFGLVWLYSQGNSIAIQINQWMSGRLSMAWQHFLKYGLNALGALTPQNGFGHSLIHTENYEFLDCTYGLILIRYGWILTILLAVLWVWMTRKAYKTGYRRLALAMAVIALHSISEHHFTELNFNILLVMPLCAFGIKSKKQSTKVDKQSFSPAWVPWITALVVGAIAALLMPRWFSWLRALFVLEGWNGGGLQSLFALLFCLVCVGIIILVWYVLSCLVCAWIREKKAPLLMMLGVLTVFVGVGVVVSFTDEMIRDGADQVQDRIAADTEAVETVLMSAKEPVYGGEIEEIYKRNFNGFSDHVFSDMELGRGAKGTMLLSHDDEGYQLINTGAKYTELSPYTGLFTYDEAVMEALQEKGYRFHGYFSAEQEVNLAELGPLNGLGIAESGELMLWGEAHSLIHGPYYDQFSGDYQATFDLQLRDLKIRTETPVREVCTLRVSTLWGQNIRAEKNIYASDFDEDGHFSVSLDYNVGDTRGIEYLVFCRDDIAVWIDRITVKKAPASDTWRTYTPEGFIESERYYTAEGEPQQQSAGHYGVAYEYGNGNNSWTKLKYLDEDGKKLKMIKSGCAQIERKYNALRQVSEEYYLDINGDPVNIYDCYASFRNEYNKDNKLLLTYYFDKEGNPVQCGSSYFHDYLQDLKERDVTIFIAVRDEATDSLTSVLLDDLKEIGVRTDLKDKYRYSYYAVITPEGSVEDSSNTETISTSGQIGDISYSITSGGYSAGNISSILINGVEYSKNSRGMNFVIFDNKTQTVIDSVCFDTHTQEMRVTR